MAGINRHCKTTWGVEPRVHHSFVQYGGVEAAGEASNIVFSNGLMDPWSVFGVTKSASKEITTVLIPNVRIVLHKTNLKAHWDSYLLSNTLPR